MDNLTDVVEDAEPIDISPILDGGVIKKIIKYGIGSNTPTNGCNVVVHYTGKLTDGTVFDSSLEREPFQFCLGKGSVIKAWDCAVLTMKKGEIAEITCKPQYAYGPAGSPPVIPPNATLIFTISMLEWKGEDVSPKKDGGILKTILKTGDEFSSPNDGAVVDIHITGEYNGEVFEDRDVTFPIGEGSEYGICPGVEKALEKFKKNERSRLEIKSKYGFGSAGKPEYNIPPNADLIYTVRLNNCEAMKENWSLDSKEKLEQAKFFKEKGTRYFSEQKFPLAIKMYKKANDFVDFGTGYTEEEEIERKLLFTAIHLNLALCYLKTGKYLLAKDSCTVVLENNPLNPKAYFRRGQAYMELNDPELAKKDFENVLSLENGNKSAIRNISACNDLIAKHRQREKKIYANMFEKFAKHDKEKEEEERKQQPDVMKTLGEWGKDEREREPTEFEKENPNILMLDGNGDFKNM